MTRTRILPNMRSAPTGEQVRENSSPEEARAGADREAIRVAPSPHPPPAGCIFASATGTVSARTGVVTARSLASCSNVGRYSSHLLRYGWEESANVLFVVSNYMKS